MCINHFSAFESAKNLHLPNTYVLKLPSKLLFGTDMFTFDTRLRFTRTYKAVNFQKIILNSKAHDQFMESRNRDLRVNAILS